MTTQIRTVGVCGAGVGLANGVGGDEDEDDVSRESRRLDDADRDASEELELDEVPRVGDEDDMTRIPFARTIWVYPRSRRSERCPCS